MVWDPRKPKIRAGEPSNRPNLGSLVGKMTRFGIKNHIFLKKFLRAGNDVLNVPKGFGTLKRPKWVPGSTLLS